MEYDIQLKDVVKWIQDLLIMQYRQSRKNRACIALLVKLLFAGMLMYKIRDLCLNVEKSIGAQLDVVGKWVGVDRLYNSIDLWDRNFLSFPFYTTIKTNTYNEFQGGFYNYTNFEERQGGFLMYKNWQDIRINVNKMGDDLYRQIIKLKIIKNSISFTRKNIDEAIWKWSDGNVYTTWSDMCITYHYTPDYEKIIDLAIYKDVLPVPTGCRLEMEAV